MKGKYLGASSKDAICPKCSKEDDHLATRTFFRDNKGYWKCGKCNYKLGRDQKMIQISSMNMVMNIKPTKDQPAFNVPNNMEVPKGNVTV
jgi:ribosomal protein L37AE/L43A